MIPDITFINPPSPFLEENLWVYPLGVLNISTYTKSIGYNVDFVDLAPYVHQCNTDEELINLVSDRVNKIKSPIIGVTSVTPQYRFLSRIPQFVQKGKRLIAGGVHATLYPKETLELGYDTVIAGEGELVIDQVMQGRIGVCRSKELVTLDLLPFPNRDWFKGYKGPAPVMAGRGCPFNCNFCARIDGPERTRTRTPQSIVEELKLIPQDKIIFYDDTFTLKKNWTIELCELIQKEGIKKKFRCSTRADKLTPEIVKVLKETGFDEVCVGVESGSQKVLDILGKRTYVKQNTEAIRICREAGLKFKAFIMLGNAGESHQTIKETWDWINENRPDKLGLYIFKPLPGCDVWIRPEKYDISYAKEGFDLCYYGGKKTVIESHVSTSSLTREDITKYYKKFLTDFRGML